MNDFVQRHSDFVTGVLSGFDRLLFRGTLMSLSYVEGMDRFLGSRGVLYKNYGQFAQELSQRLKDHAQELARREGRPFEYLASSSQRKEEVARRIMQREGIKQGLICVLSCVEPCRTISVRADRSSRRLKLVSQERKCLHLYFYYADREFGLMHVRLQTWLPMPIQVCINGREYLARRMEGAGMIFEKRENCFVRIDDLPRAQKMLEGLETRRWERTLNALARRVNPLTGPRGGMELRGYYWSIRESEYATDVMFKDAASLKAVYPDLMDHAMKRMDSQEVLRFLGRRTNSRFSGEVTSDIQLRSEGMRIKHRVEENSIKMYDKQGSVLRIETTINNPRRFKVWRKCRRQGRPKKAWIPMRKGLADIRRRVQVCQGANERYLTALSVVGQRAPVQGLLDPVSRRVVRDDRPYRPLRPISPTDAQVFAAVMSGSFLLHGFTNRQLRLKLADGHEQPDPIQRRRASGRITRVLRLLRAHGLIRKVSRTRYYRTTDAGRSIMTAALQVRTTDVRRLAA
jgi:DNA-binding PadR family transcriptional regulator